MIRPYQILVPLFSLFLVRVDLTDLSPLELKVDILKVYDGDTVLVSRGSFKTKVRLSRIDAPEKDQPFLVGKPGAGNLSTKCLARLLEKNAILKIEGTDMYGRILGDLNGVSLSLVKEGCVALYPYAKFSSSREKFLYLQNYFKAREYRRGLWAFGGIIQPKAWRKKNKSRKRI